MSTKALKNFPIHGCPGSRLQQLTEVVFPAPNNTSFKDGLVCPPRAMELPGMTSMIKCELEEQLAALRQECGS